MLAFKKEIDFVMECAKTYEGALAEFTKQGIGFRQYVEQQWLSEFAEPLPEGCDGIIESTEAEIDDLLDELGLAPPVGGLTNQ
ncbi:MAG: hypothetical protein GXP26_05065 [Planctomycetes bacterium]|nr:hypothetical protein [Planctomycetota bacterium]